MDTRGQGSGLAQRRYPDIPDGANPFVPGFMTQGILDPKSYYYRRVFTDAVRAIEAARGNVAVDEDRIAVTGASQGGGITIAVSGLLPDIPVAMPEVPFLCHFPRAIGLTENAPYSEIVHYLSVHRDKEDTVFQHAVLFRWRQLRRPLESPGAVFDGAHGYDLPPSTVFAAYNYVDATKEIKVYRFKRTRRWRQSSYRRKDQIPQWFVE